MRGPRESRPQFARHHIDQDVARPRSHVMGFLWRVNRKGVRPGQAYPVCSIHNYLGMSQMANAGEFPQKISIHAVVIERASK